MAKEYRPPKLAKFITTRFSSAYAPTRKRLQSILDTHDHSRRKTGYNGGKVARMYDEVDRVWKWGVWRMLRGGSFGVHWVGRTEKEAIKTFVSWGCAPEQSSYAIRRYCEILRRMTAVTDFAGRKTKVIHHQGAFVIEYPTVGLPTLIPLGKTYREARATLRNMRNR